jgi:hypothetical protein
MTLFDKVHWMPDLQQTAPPIDYASPNVQRRPLLRRWVWLALLTATLLVAGAFFIVDVAPRGGESHRAWCAKNLRQIGLACLVYANEHSNQYPDSLGVVLRDEDIVSDVFVCPDTTDTRARGATTQAMVANLTAGGHLSYIYVGKGLTSAASATAILAYEPLANHKGEGSEVLYADGHLEFQIPMTARKIIAELQSGHNPPRPEKLK